MPNIFHQSVEDILKAATPEQRILWNQIFLRFGERATISQYIHFGLVSAAPFSAYTARRVFVAYQAIMSGIGLATATPYSGALYDENNAVNGSFSSNEMAWDATAAAIRYNGIEVELKNIYFSRIVPGAYSYIRFIGYMVNY